MTPAEPGRALLVVDRDAMGFVRGAATWPEVAALSVWRHMPDPPAGEGRAR